jgi:hypothetical protein
VPVPGLAALDVVRPLAPGKGALEYNYEDLSHDKPGYGGPGERPGPDHTPLGRDEDKLSYGMAWVRHHDKYGTNTATKPT